MLLDEKSRKIPDLLPVKGNWGSFAAIVIGFLSIGAGLQPPAGDAHHFNEQVCGLIMLIGAFAYRSAKIRRQSVERQLRRQVFEMVAVLAILLLWLGRKDFLRITAEDPWPTMIVPVWVLVAYAVAFSKTRKAKLSERATA